MPGRSYTMALTGSIYKYAGKELDEESGLNWYYFGARYFDPQIGRFLSVDPLAGKFPAWSPYNYAYNNPLRFIDPTGMAPDEIDDDLHPKNKGSIGLWYAFVDGVNNFINEATTVITGSVSIKVLGAEAKFEIKDGQIVKGKAEGSGPSMDGGLGSVSQNSEGNLEISTLGSISSDGQKLSVGPGLTVKAGLSVGEGSSEVSVLEVGVDVSVKKVMDINDFNKVAGKRIEEMMKPVVAKKQGF